MPQNSYHLSEAIKQEAAALGFDACGIAHAAPLQADREHFSHWLEKGHHGKMGYMANHFEKRIDPRKLLPGAKSMIVVALNYYPAEKQPPDSRLKVSKYAYGKDYHFIIKEKLRKLIRRIADKDPQSRSREFTDSAPIMERSWAQRAGLGWTGKNACLILPKEGSFFFIGEILTTAPLKADEPFLKEHCGNCTRCMEACPTGAIIAPGEIDARRCISYLTIELKEPIPPEFKNKTKGWIFGCDICQDVCPFNRFAYPHREESLKPLPFIKSWNDKDWKAMDKPTYNREVKKNHSPIARVKFEKLMHNIAFQET